MILNVTLGQFGLETTFDLINKKNPLEQTFKGNSSYL